MRALMTQFRLVVYLVACLWWLWLVVLLAVAGCAEEHRPRYPVEVDISELTDCARATVIHATGAWNSAIGQTVFWIGEDGVRFTQEPAPVQPIHIYNDGHGTIYLGDHCSWRYSVMHELGHVLGLEDDYEHGSIMHEAPWPHGLEILPSHVEKVRELMGLPPAEPLSVLESGQFLRRETHLFPPYVGDRRRLLASAARDGRAVRDS